MREYVLPNGDGASSVTDASGLVFCVLGFAAHFPGGQKTSLFPNKLGVSLLCKDPLQAPRQVRESADGIERYRHS